MIKRVLLACGIMSLAGFTIPSPALAAGDNASALLTKMRGFFGWQLGDPTMKALTVTETIVRDKDGKPDETRVTHRIGAIYRTDIRAIRTDTTDAVGFTGNIGWQTNRNGFTTPLIGDAAKFELSQDLIFAGALSALDGSMHGSTSIDGKTYQGVLLKQPNAFPMIAYIDPSSGEVKRIVIDEGGSYETTMNLLSFKDVNGKKYFGSFKFKDSSFTHRVDSVAVEASIPNDRLEPPGQSAQWAFNNANPIPIKLTTYRVMVTAKVNGTEGHFILDTGADGLYFTRDFADKAKLKRVASTQSFGIGGAAKDSVVHVDTVDIGGNVLSNLVASASQEGGSGGFADGLMGFDVFGGAIVTLDLEGQTLQLQDPGADLSSVKGIKVGVDLSTGQPRVPMKINGDVDTIALLDTGSPTVTLVSPDLRHHGLNMLIDNSVQGVLASYRPIGGVGGYEIGECGHVNAITLGPISYQFPNTCYSPSFSDRESLVGLDFLRGMSKIYFDYPHSALIFVPKNE